MSSQRVTGVGGPDVPLVVLFVVLVILITGAGGYAAGSIRGYREAIEEHDEFLQILNKNANCHPMETTR